MKFRSEGAPKPNNYNEDPDLDLDLENDNGGFKHVEPSPGAVERDIADLEIVFRDLESFCTGMDRIREKEQGKYPNAMSMSINFSRLGEDDMKIWNKFAKNELTDEEFSEYRNSRPSESDSRDFAGYLANRVFLRGLRDGHLQD